MGRLTYLLTLLYNRSRLLCRLQADLYCVIIVSNTLRNR